MAADAGQPPRFAPALMYKAASLYYEGDATQAEIADRLGVSRPTVSRLLSEARRAGIVRIDVVAPIDRDLDALGTRLAAALGLGAAWIAPESTRGTVGENLAPALSAALRATRLERGDVLIVSTGRTVYEAAQAALPQLPGVTLAPMIGGQDEPEVWYAPNEIIRQFAVRIGGDPVFLYAPALPGPELHDTLLDDPSTRRVFELWSRARCAVLGVGAPPLTRASLPRFIASDTGSLRESVGDVCSRFYDARGDAVAFPGYDRLIATGFERLREIPTTIAVAAGTVKVPSILTGAASGYFNQLVTDADTALALIEAGDGGASEAGSAQARLR
jgi:DNA-binding transcriptional regulator LsrR (DeoR family)